MPCCVQEKKIIIVKGKSAYQNPLNVMKLKVELNDHKIQSIQDFFLLLQWTSLYSSCFERTLNGIIPRRVGYSLLLLH